MGLICSVEDSYDTNKTGNLKKNVTKGKSYHYAVSNVPQHLRQGQRPAPNPNRHNGSSLVSTAADHEHISYKTPYFDSGMAAHMGDSFSTSHFAEHAKETETDSLPEYINETEEESAQELKDHFSKHAQEIENHISKL